MSRRRSRHTLCLALVTLGSLLGCGRESPRPEASPPVPGAALPPFTDVTAAAGIAFRHAHGGTSPLNILQTAGSGCAFFDYDNDGWLDILLLSSATNDQRRTTNDERPTTAAPGSPRSSLVVRRWSSVAALYRNNRDGTFTDVTAQANLSVTGYAMGCAVGDIEGDGDLDLYVTNYGPNVLFRNNGDGTFTDVTAQARVAAGGWSTSAGFADYDGDGDLDLYVTRYVRFDERSQQLCLVRGVEMACPPHAYPPQSGILYRNDGRGTFSDVTKAAGVFNPRGKGLGVVWGDCDNDGDLDLFVANDGTANNLFLNDGRGRFRDVGLLRGVAYGENGEEQASMGVDWGDYDGDGDLDLFVTNFQDETDALYRNDGPRGFSYATFDAGIGEPSLRMLGFGTGFFDFDNDGDLDLFTANGHVQDTRARVEPEAPFAQPRQLYENLGEGRFRDLSAQAGPAFTRPAVGRGAAFGDYDNDGDLDLLVNNNGGPPMLLRNDTGSARRWLRLRLAGEAPNPFAVGARVTVQTGPRKQIRELCAGHSYASASDFRLHFGLGNAATVDIVTVRWPDGSRSVLKGVAANQELTVRQP